MSFLGENDRKIIPRWRNFRASVGHAQNRDTPDAAEPASFSLQSNIEDWERENDLWTALDLVAGAIVENRLDKATSALERVRHDPLTPRAALKLIDEHERNATTDEEQHSSVEERCRLQIRASRTRLATYPYDAIEWIELARSFTTLGLLDKGQRCISAAVTLAPADVFVLRSASRFYIQQSNPERAQWILTRAPRTLMNPWLLASEIAAAAVAGRDSSLIRVARRIETADFGDEDLTELRAALATSEIDTGNERIGKKLLRRALVGANENSLAQVQWMDRTRLGNVIDISTAKPPQRYEAGAWRSYFEGKWNKSATCSLQWFQDQPFSEDAGIFASFILADLAGRPGEALKVLEVARRANPSNRALMNNLAFAYVQLDQLVQAEAVLESMALKLDDVEDAGATATAGLLNFRKGLAEEGRELYNNAIRTLSRNGSSEMATRATIHLALEEVRAKTPNALAASRLALESASETRQADFAQRLGELEAELKRWPIATEGPGRVPHS